jgi:DNA polymerase-1
VSTLVTMEKKKIMSRTVIIDGDVIVYKTAEAVSDSYEINTSEDDEFIYRNIGWASKSNATNYVDNLITQICKETKSDEVCICLSDMTANFRKLFNPNYKKNRKSIKPILYEFIRNYLSETGYKFYERPQLEADDVIGILATSTKIIKGDKVVWSLDKDFKTIPCKFFRAKPMGLPEKISISEDEANWWFMYQTLIGDTVDGYFGCKGIGDKTARKILGEGQSLEAMWKLVVEAYLSKGYTEEDALLNARCARILRCDDYDFKNKEIKLWQIKL